MRFPFPGAVRGAISQPSRIGGASHPNRSHRSTLVELAREEFSLPTYRDSSVMPVTNVAA